MSITAKELNDRHSDFGEDITVNDADGREYHQPTCRCSMPLGMHLSLDDHRAQEFETYDQERIAEAETAHKATLHRLEIMVSREMELHDTPMHIQANLDQIVTEAWVGLGVTEPVADQPAAADGRVSFI